MLGVASLPYPEPPVALFGTCQALKGIASQFLKKCSSIQVGGMTRVQSACAQSNLISPKTQSRYTRLLKHKYRLLQLGDHEGALLAC